MLFENFENIVSLFCTIVGLLFCVFKYVETHKKGYRFIIAFFLANFLSEYYWTIYELITNDYPDVSQFMAYLGWNIGFLCLMFGVYYIRTQEEKRYFHPIILLPILLNIPQLILYCTFGGILNNIWEVGVTTATAVFALQAILYYFKNKGKKTHFPLFSFLALIYLLFTYGKWTSSCFDWSSEFLNPYLYFSVFGSVLGVFLVYGVLKFYSYDTNIHEQKSASELRFQVLMEAIATLIIIFGCAVGAFTAINIKNNIASGSGFFHNKNQIASYLFIISVVLIVLIIVLLYLLSSRYKYIMQKAIRIENRQSGKIVFAFTIIITLALMTFIVIYNNQMVYKASVVSMYENADEVTETTATELENYLTVAVTTLRVTADSVDLMVENNESHDAILKYITDQTNKQFEQFDDNFTGIYALIDGVYMDGTAWAPPEGYIPEERDWYKTAVSGNGEVVIVSPYVDAQTSSVVITIAKRLSNNGNEIKNVVCIDVIVNYINEITSTTNIAGKGYGMVINGDGFIIAHKESEYRGKNISEVYGDDVLNNIINADSGRISMKLNDNDSSLFVFPVMEQWYVVTVIEDAELFEDTYLKLAVSVLVSLITFGLITFFYYIGFKNEQIYGKKVEEINIQVVTALAQAIDAKDNYTNGHSTRVASYAKMIAAKCGYSKEEQVEIYMAGLLHDVGKIGVPDEVINKKSKLSEEEFELIKRHPSIGSSILESIKERPLLAIGARWHHERYDGTGYPDGLSGENIPEVARIIAVADAYDAMTSKRSYRDVLPREKVIDEIKTCSGTQFDPQFADAMLKLIEDDPDYLMKENKKD